LFFKSVAGVGALEVSAGSGTAGHETTERNVPIESNREQVAHIQKDQITPNTVSYFDRSRVVQKKENVDPIQYSEYGATRTRYGTTNDQSALLIRGENASGPRILAFGPARRSEPTKPLDEADGESELPSADFGRKPARADPGEEVDYVIEREGSNRERGRVQKSQQKNEDQLLDSTLIAIPAYNEAATIGSVVHAAREHSDNVLVLDDGSSDPTSQIAGSAGAMVTRLEQNRGKGAAIRQIFEFTRKEGYEYLVVLDADWQHNPHEIPKLVRPLKRQSVDIVIGSRYLNGDRGDTPLYRRFGQRVLDLITNVGSRQSITDSQSGYRAFNRAAIERLDVSDSGFGIEAQMLHSATNHGLEIFEVPIEVNYDVPNPSTSNSFLHGIRVVDTLLTLIRDQHPLLFFGVPGTLLMGAGLGYGVWTLSLYDSGQGFYMVKALISSVLFIMGMLSVYSALIMNMIGNHVRRHD
jgi:glycosyltransferase involved in cell wall biosynthesis